MKTILVKSNIDPACPRLYVRNAVKEDGNAVILDEPVEMDEGPTNVVSIHDCCQFNADMVQIINTLLDQAEEKIDMAIKLAAANLQPLVPPISPEEAERIAQDIILRKEPTVWH
jgi:hypothetical protein